MTAEAVIEALVEFSVAAPSWAVGTGGTRFGRFPGGGEPRTTEEKIDDVAALDALTRSNGAISLHVPWDDPADPAALRHYAEERSIGFDAMNSNTFQDNPSTTAGGTLSYKFGSLANSDPAVRQAAVDHNRYVIDLGSNSGRRRSRCGWPTGSTIPARPTTAPSSSGSPPGPSDPRPPSRRMAHVHRAQAVRARLLRRP